MDNELKLHEQGQKIDYAHLNRMTAGDISLILEVAGIFRNQSQMWQKLLDPNTPTQEWMVGAHTLKGSASGIGAWELAKVCAAAEEASKKPAISRDEKFIWREKILHSLSEVLDELSHYEYRLNIQKLRA